MIAITIFVATYFDMLPSWHSIIGVAIFLVAYSSIYYYNDLLDYETDKKRAFMPPEKLLYHGKASQRDYIHLLAWVSVAGVAAAFMYSPLLGIVTALAILTNHARTVIRNLALREFLLAVVELLNFEAFWIAMYGSPIPGVALPLFVTYSAAYGFTHAAYKLRSKPLLWALRQWWMLLLGSIVVLAAAFSIPLVVSSTAHLFALLAFSITYVGMVGAQAMRYADDVEGGMERIMRAHDVAILVTTVFLMLLGAGIVYASLPTTPLPVSAPPEMTTFLSNVDVYQYRLLELASRL